MKNKILISTLLLLTFLVIISSQAFATNNMMQSAGNAVMNVGNAIGNAAAQTGNTIINGTENLANDASNTGNDMMNDRENLTDDTTAVDTGYTDYTATRTANDPTTLFGMSDTMSTWLILGVVGAIIVGLIWYYGAQYEHRNYDND